MSGKPIIELTDADIFQREELVLRNVTLKVEEGEFVYLIGRVGTGKSSLIKTLNAEIPLVSGTGRVLDYDLNALRNRDVPMLRRKLGVVFQDFRLLSDRNVKANLEFVLKATGWKQPKAIEERIHQVLELVGMEHQLVRMPHRLSGGEQQRVVIARAMLNDPPLILADEPTGNLDPETSEQILGLLQELNHQGKTVVMATHDYALIGKHKARTLSCEGKKVTDVTKADGELDFNLLM
ncbi:MAG: ATP-binding cassette domain-containing protein [Prolixibacteraceae bacterium]|nr:ATP-binding cassette domain-containing protein [Prolixibacteraceae bacterium]NLX27591.1 ATP-binding cassette domain-containing protein [Bacteroidales bacterium]HNQ37842.1 ATP-binding cassette domain-containing protein [Prolixibacteraceae bacterium]HPJ79439.1 ATP-binding cassette domain-containing protein [Prolixibacteraceae bacterium]HRV88824.1 ATP-binding cassette domain-containing protein [Prolixibacteraceae bacterium]